MTDVRDATNALLADHPDLEDDLQTLLKVDARQETWTFNEVPLDSGAFGELVSYEVAEQVDNEYRLADPDAVQAAIEGDEQIAEPETHHREASVSLPPRRVSLALLGALVVVAAFRLIAYPSVFRGEHVVLLSNDPYYYRYLLFQSLDQGVGVMNLPESVHVGEPLLLATLLAITKLAGGTQTAASYVLAWYPIVAGIVTAGLAYVLTVQLTTDRRVGLAAVTLLAVTPVHAYRTSVGFADHHPFDFLWLTITVVAAVALIQRSTGTPLDQIRNPTTLAWIGLLGAGIGAQVLAWNAGPLLLVPLAVYGVARTTAAVAKGDSLLGDLPLVVGIAVGALLAIGAHAAFGWQDTYIVVIPFLLTVGLGSVMGAGEIARRFNVSGALAFGGIIVTGGLIFALAYIALPEFATQFTQELNRLFVGGTEAKIAETKSLFSAGYGTITGPFFFFGLTLFFALPYLAWSLYTGWMQGRPAWTLVGSYGSVFFIFSLLQVRFAGQLSLVTAPFVGLAFVHFAAITDTLEPPAILSEEEDTHHSGGDHETEASALSIPDRNTIVALVFIFLLIGGLGIVMTPLRTNLLTISDERYHAAVWMDDYSDKQEWNYPQNYVFSGWSYNRMYNAFVSGQSRSYGYAQANYGDFITSANASSWYQRLHDRTGFIVVARSDGPSTAPEKSIFNRLQNEWGSETGHYRAVWVSDDASIMVYTLVPGAKIVGQTTASDSVTVTYQSSISGQTFTYEQSVQVAQDGTYTTRVPYAGTYTVDGVSTTVTETAVRNGKTVNVTAT